MESFRAFSAARQLLRAAFATAFVAATLLGPARAGEGDCPKLRSAALSGSAELGTVTTELRRQGRVEVLAIGSSSTEGVGATSKAASYPAQLEQDLEAAWAGSDVAVDNAGIGGETADQTVGRLEVALSLQQPDLVIWQVGTNDAVRGGDEEAFRRLLRRGIAAARSHRTDLVLLDQQYFPAIKDPARYERFVSIVRETALQEGVSVFSRYRMMKAWADEAPGTLTSMLASDGFHMSDRGYDCLAVTLGGAIASLVPHRPARATASLLRTREVE